MSRPLVTTGPLSLPPHRKAWDLAMVSTRRPPRCQGTLLLDTFGENAAGRNTSTPNTSADLQASLPSYAVLRGAGFVTAVGCVCAVPMLIDRDGEKVGLRVELQRLELAGKALGESLRRSALKALASTGECIDEKSVWLSADLVAAQWARLPRLETLDSKDSRTKFVERFKRILKARYTPEEAETGGCTSFPPYGVPVSAAGIDESLLEELTSHLGLPYARGSHYGLGWALHTQLVRHREIDFNGDEEREGLVLASMLGFVLGRAVPSQARRLNAEDQDELRRVQRGVATPVVSEDVLQYFPSDGRMLIVADISTPT